MSSLFFFCFYFCLQFDYVVLKSALWLLDKAGLVPKAMSNVVHVTRTMTSMVSTLFITDLSTMIVAIMCHYVITFASDLSLQLKRCI